MESIKSNLGVWFEIYVEDMNRAKNFYESVFDIKLEKMPTDIEMYGFPGEMTNYGANGALVKMEGFSVGQNSVLIYFGCEDCSNEERLVLKSGGKVEKPKKSIGEYGYISIVYDTEGNMFGLVSQK